MSMRDVPSKRVLLLVFTAIILHSVAAPQAHEADDPRHEATKAQITRRSENYTLPPVNVVREDGRTVSLSDELNDGRLVVLNFVYTSCTAVCPMSSHVFSQLQSRIGSNLAKVHLVSISIDPEQDTPAKLADYAKRFEAGPNWQHYTGTRATSLSVQRSFNAYRGDKMNHAPVTFVRAKPDQSWLRIDGFATADDLLADINRLLAQP